MQSERAANPEQAELLLNPALGPLLARLCGAPAGAAVLARTLGRPLSSTHAVLQRLVRAGLVTETLRPRAGRPLREYAMPDRWTVPFEVTPAATLRDLLASSMTPRVNDHLDGLAAVMTRLDCRWVIQVWAQDGHWHHNITPNVQPGPALEPILARGVDVRLSETRAREFARRFVSLIREMEDAQQEGEPVWSFTALLTPES